MAKDKSKPRKKSKAPILRTGAKVIIWVDGARRILPTSMLGKADYTTLGWHIDNGSSLKQIISDPAVRQKAVGPIIGAVEIGAGGVVVDEAYKLTPREAKSLKLRGGRKVV